MNDRKLQVLVIEDDVDYVDMIRLCLDEPDSMGMKFGLDWADRLETGLKLLGMAPFDAVLLDVMLPDSRGIETVRQVLACAPETAILVMTNMGDEKLAFEAMALGAQDYMVKGTSDSRLLKRAIWYAIDCRKLLTQSESLIRRAPDGMMVVDGSGLVQYVNPAGELLCGRAAPELIGRPCPYPVVEGETNLLKLPDPAGGERSVEMRVTAIDWKGRPARLAAMRDVTALQKFEQIKAEIRERRRVDQLKDELIGTVSHELRTPLSIAQGAVDNLRHSMPDALGERQRHLVVMAHRNLNRLSKMIGNLLDLSRLESGRALAERRDLALGPLVEECLSNFAPAAEEKSVVLERRFDASLPEVRADPDMLVQLLSNLLDNALRYAKERVVVAAEPAPGGVRVSVADDGPGVPPERVGDLFNKFVQVNRSAGPGYKGTGLGLAICKEIMALHGSTVEVENQPGSGARFSFVLPVARASAPSNGDGPARREAGA